jgi:hypothetical protein
MTRALLVVAVGLALGAGSAGAAQAPANPLPGFAVPKAQLGRLAQGLQIELKSGITSNARAADDSFDPNDTEASVKAAGRETGYTLLYGDVGWTPFRTGHGLVEIGTSLDGFRTAQQAKQFQLKALRDIQAAVGKNLQGTIVERARRFPVTGLNPKLGAVGIELVQRLGNHRLHTTFIDFQIANILCEAVINRGDAQSARRDVTTVALQLGKRIQAFGAGQNPAPVTLPRPLGTVKPGAGAPDLSAMVPTGADLKGKAGVVDQSFTPDDDAITSYVRQYSFGSNSTTGVLSLRATAALERTAREAAGRLFVLRSVLTGPEAGETLARQIAPGATIIHSDGAQSAKVGDESFAAGVSFTAAGQRLRAVIVIERRDRILGTAVLIGTAKKLTLAGALPYAKLLDKRIKSALKPALVA